MSSWNYRILAFPYINKEKSGKTHEGVMLRFAEVYYNDEGVANGYKEHSTIGAETITDLKWTVIKLKDALKKPILWADDRFPNEYVKS